MGREKKHDLSILIPARNEEFLSKTIQNILENSEADTEVIAVLDGVWAQPVIEDHDRVTLIYFPESVGQRAGTNFAAKISTSPWLMKLDAHCAMSPGFDKIMLEDIQPDMTMVPLMKNLNAFDWVCENCGWRKYQGPVVEECPKCGSPNITRDIVFAPRKNTPNSTAMCFDKELHFQYWGELKARQKKQGDLVETMSLIGACFMLSQEKYWELNICDEAHGSWGQQGTEVACKTWLSGGRLIVNKRAWFAHLFRTQKGFGFPYHISGNQVSNARKYSQNMWMPGGDITAMPNWDKAIHPLSWLVEKFKPVKYWHYQPGEKEEIEVSSSQESEEPLIAPVAIITREGPSKGILYYTDSQLDEKIMLMCQAQLKKSELPIVSVSLKPLDFGYNIAMPLKRGYVTMFKQILAGIETLGVDIIFFAEHDVLYHPSHFDFTPERDDLFYYNQRMWKVNYETGEALFHYSNHTSQLCACRSLLLEHYTKRVAICEALGDKLQVRKMGFEPGTHNRAERVDDYKYETWMSDEDKPNIDIRHGQNLTTTRWKKEEFRNQRYTKGWEIRQEVPGWGNMLDFFREA